MRASVTTIAATFVLLAACAKSEVPAPNKNTNWLQECESDADCGGELSCLRGVCTVACEDDDVCEAAGGGAQCDEGVCLVPSELEDAGAPDAADASSADSSVDPLDTGVEDSQDSGAAPEPPCILVEGACAEVFAAEQERPNAIAVRGDRVYWLDDVEYDPESGSFPAKGSLESALVTGGGRLTLASDLKMPRSLVLDATHAYMILDTDVALPPHARIVRVSLAGGPLETLVSGAQDIDAIAVDDASLYWLGTHDAEPMEVDAGIAGPSVFSRRLYRLPKTGAPGPTFETLPEHLVVEDAIGSTAGLVSTGTSVFWKDGPRIRAFDIATATDRMVAASGDTIEYSSGPDILVRGDALIWLWCSATDAVGVSSLDLATMDSISVDDEPLMGVALGGAALDDEHVYWAQQIGEAWAVLRKDRETGVTTTLVQSNALWAPQIAVSDDHVFVTVIDTVSGEPNDGAVIRLPRR